MTETDRFHDVAQTQEEIYQWSLDNFGEQDAVNPLIGAQEELGEVSRLALKERQGIRQEELAGDDLEVEVADVIIYLMDFCARNDVEMADGLATARQKVLGRDFDED